MRLRRGRSQLYASRPPALCRCRRAAAAANERTAQEAEKGAQNWGQLTREVSAALEPGRAAQPAEDAAAAAAAVKSSGARRRHAPALP